MKLKNLETDVGKGHIHTWARMKKSKTMYRCEDPSCTTVKHKNHILGKYSRCNRCHEIFILDRIQLCNSKPVCRLCSGSRKALVSRAASAVMEELLAEMEIEKVETMVEVKGEERDGNITGGV